MYGTYNLQRHCHTLLIRSPPAADGLSRHTCGDVITPYPPPLPLPDGEGDVEEACERY